MPPYKNFSLQHANGIQLPSTSPIRVHLSACHRSSAYLFTLRCAAVYLCVHGRKRVQHGRTWSLCTAKVAATLWVGNNGQRAAPGVMQSTARTRVIIPFDVLTALIHTLEMAPFPSFLVGCSRWVGCCRWVGAGNVAGNHAAGAWVAQLSMGSMGSTGQMIKVFPGFWHAFSCNGQLLSGCSLTAGCIAY